MPLPDVAYSVFELDFFGEKGRLRVVDSERRVELFAARPDADLRGLLGAGSRIVRRAAR